MKTCVRYVAGGVCMLTAALGLAACAQRLHTHPSRITAAFNGFYGFQAAQAQSGGTTRAVAARILDRYRAEFALDQTRAAVTKAGDDDLALLFRAADLEFFYTVSPAALRDMQLDSAELHRRGVARDGEDDKLYSALIESRRFGEARAFAKRYPVARADTVARMTDRSAGTGPTALLVSDGGTTLERRAVDLGERRIVVVSSPLCHFSQRAVRGIEADDVLRPLFHANASWIVPPDESTPFSTVASWNRHHPHETMQYAYRRDEWPMVDRWETPVFYFFRDGRVVGKVTGWPVQGRRAQIERSLRAAGLL